MVKMRVVVDSSVIIDLLRSKDKVSSVYFQLASKAESVAAMVTVVELYSGKSVQRGKARAQLEEVMRGITVYTSTVELMQQAGKLKYKYQLSLADACIAAVALKLKAPLVSLDVKAFKRVKGLKLYSLKT